MEKDVPFQPILDDVLRVSPVITVEIQRHGIDSLRLRQVVGWKHIAAGAKVILIHQLSDVCRQEVGKKWNLGNGTNRSSLGAQILENTCRCIPVHSRYGISQVV